MSNPAAAVKLLLLDVDGVLTSGEIILGEQDEFKIFNVQDGLGITLARLAGLKVGIITGRTSTSVSRRAQELKMDFLVQGAFAKNPELDKILKSTGISLTDVCYMGDDLLDLPLLRRVGFPAAPADARPEVLKAAGWISRLPGGRGAVRELVEHILHAKGIWEQTIEELI
ncbi:MAG: HAD hydrolase family protein [Candidatus Delongbacteria bacterium]|nr:HAD hydrolase family protein [Candidatus Delongbacteria bacterium]